jgi:hypothetical protein
MRYLEHVPHMGGMRNEYKIFVRSSQRMRQLGKCKHRYQSDA